MTVEQDDWKRFSLRLPPDVFDAVQAEAKRNMRSVNAEIATRLRTTLVETAKRSPLLDKLYEELDALNLTLPKRTYS